MSAASAEPAVTLTRQGAVAVITVNRPAAINAINDAVRTGLPQVMFEADSDAAIRVLVITGAGDRGFSVGADIKEMRGGEPPVVAHDRLRRAGLWPAFSKVEKPTIAAIHGFCLGGGFEMALACDIRVASADALFALPETALGLIPGGGGTQRLARLIGAGRALDMVLSGERIGADEAHRLGVVSRVYESREELQAEVLVLAQRIAQRPPVATRYAKHAVHAGLDLPLDAGLALERHLFTLLLSTKDHQEAAAAFVEKRQPVFTGA